MLFVPFACAAVSGEGELPSVRRLLGNERRRTDNFGLSADFDCKKTAFTWTASAWSPYSGAMSFDAPYVADGFYYGFEKKSSASSKSFGNIVWWDGEPGTSPQEEDGFWLLNPRNSWFNKHSSLHHYMNFDSADEASNADVAIAQPGSDVDFWYCYVPTPSPTPAPTPTPTPAPTPSPTKATLLYWDPENDLGGTVANIAGFLSQGAWESATWTACDENNHSGYTAEKPHPVSGLPAECTQREDGNLYQDVAQSPHSCALDATMDMEAETHASWAPVMHCVPGTATENCCWWGRGSIQTTGPGNYGDLQHNVIAKRANSNIDLCKNPEALCQEDDLKWTAGVYFWVSQVQKNSCFTSALNKYTEAYDATATAGDCHAFADGVGGVVNNGAWNAHAHGNEGRQAWFTKFMTALKPKVEAYDKDAPNASPSSCTGNDAVDTVLEQAGLESLAQIDAAASQYTWSGLCTALKEFL